MFRMNVKTLLFKRFDCKLNHTLNTAKKSLTQLISTSNINAQMELIDVHILCSWLELVQPNFAQ